MLTCTLDKEKTSGGNEEKLHFNATFDLTYQSFFLELI